MFVSSVNCINSINPEVVKTVSDNDSSTAKGPAPTVSVTCPRR